MSKWRNGIRAGLRNQFFCGFKSHLGYQRWQYDNLPLYASVAEQADAPDLKSGVRDGVRVQFPSEVPYRGVAQLVEQRSPKPCCVCSNRITPAICEWSRAVRVRTANPSKAGSTPVVRSNGVLRTVYSDWKMPITLPHFVADNHWKDQKSSAEKNTVGRYEPYIKWATSHGSPFALCCKIGTIRHKK